jgi:hypothetical protein
MMYQRLRILPLSLLFLIACTHAPDARRDAPFSPPSEPASVNLRAIVIPAAGAERALASGEHLSEGQQFAVRVTVHASVHLYVVLTHRGGASQLIHRTDSPLARADALRIPAADAWVTVPALSPGDRLCLVSSTVPLALMPDCTPEDEDPLRPRHPPRQRPAPPTKGNAERFSPATERIPLPTADDSRLPSSY